MLPTKLQSREQTIYERFQKLSGEEFDREYIRTTLEDHRRDLREFHSEAAGTPDQSLRTTVQDGARLLHQQLAAADQLARSRGSQNARPAKVADSIPPR